VFTLKVTDNAGLTDTDDVTLTVNPASGGSAPVANAGADKTLTLPTNWTTFSGSGTDSDGTIKSYQWTKKSGGAVMLAYPTTAKLGVSGLVAGTYVFTLTVTDNSGKTGSDDVTLIVKTTSSAPAAPVADAGTDKTVTLPTNATSLAGSGTDSDGSITSYAWTKKSGGTATLSNANTSSLSVSGLAAETYVFTLKVTDNSGATATDDVTVIVKPSGATGAPVANAGADKTTTMPINWTTFSGSGTDNDGTIKSYQWTKKSGGAVMLAYPTSARLGVSGLVVGTYVFTLTVTDNSGLTATDDVTLVVLAAGATATFAEARMAGDSTTEETFDESVDQTSASAKEGVSSEEEFVFMNKHYPGGYAYAVIIFNNDGDQIFQGEWNPENYNEVFTQRGFYLYQVIQNGVKIDSGKAFINK
jgi:predicted NUDIX family NTP pyrophosphohydrolase